MEFGGRYLFSAPRAAVWAALNDAEKLRSAIPGCQRLDWTSEATLDLEIKVDLGLMKPVFGGELILSDVVAAQRYTLSGRGKGSVLGKAHAAADIALNDASGGTELSFTAHGGADGPIMKLGKSLIGNSAQKVIDGFFERIGDAMGASVTPLTR